MTDKEVIEIIRAYADMKKKYENLLSALDEPFKQIEKILELLEEK